ncbi:uncharacterized protein LOC127796818 [Diospyros lotus]|uniref:uncharacterized protein LOC127796818 n=1 Tax=Diospyros lotus TaxID=55363 RepID=UPI002250C290|nr:uncharacterized protein LOC127796818 [Diospyros lotus]
MDGTTSFESHPNQASRGIPVRPPRKVVSIPVRFVGSEETTQMSRTASTLKIQKVFRGFLVRKSLKKIRFIGRQVEEVETRLSRGVEAVELIRRDAKERIRVNEELMALLFQLDSIRGVDVGVRNCRKAVIKKVIALQERVDNAFVVVEVPQVEEQSAEVLMINSDNGAVAVEIEESDEGKKGAASISSNRDTESAAPICEQKDIIIEAKGGDGEGKTKVWERMMMDNESMVNLVKQLLDRNEMQSRMLNSLTQRVGELERAVALTA